MKVSSVSRIKWLDVLVKTVVYHKQCIPVTQVLGPLDFCQYPLLKESSVLRHLRKNRTDDEGHKLKSRLNFTKSEESCSLILTDCLSLSHTVSLTHILSVILTHSLYLALTHCLSHSHTYSLACTHSHSHTLVSLTHTHTLLLPHTLTLTHCLSLSLTHAYSLSLSHTHTHTLIHGAGNMEWSHIESKEQGISW